MRTFKEWQFFKLKMTMANSEASDEQLIDLLTWKRWLNDALRRTHGIFGEGIEYSILNQDNKVAYLRVGYRDRDIFSSAISTYISKEELAGIPVIVKIEQECSNLSSLNVGDDDLIWYRRALENEKEDQHSSVTI